MASGKLGWISTQACFRGSTAIDSKQKVITVQSYNIVCQSKSQSPDDEIREEHLKHIAEITKDLTPLIFANLTEDQQELLDRKGRYAPYRPRTGN